MNQIDSLLSAKPNWQDQYKQLMTPVANTAPQENMQQGTKMTSLLDTLQNSQSVNFMDDPRYQPIQSANQIYAPTIEQQVSSGDKFSTLGVIGDFFRLIEQGGGVRPNGQVNNPNNISK